MKALVLAIGPLALVLCILGCSSAPSASGPAVGGSPSASPALLVPSPSAAAAGGPLAHVIVAVPSQSLSWFPLQMAVDQGIMRNLGLDVQIMQMEAPAAMAALQNGEVAYTTALGTSVQASARGLPITTILAICDEPQHVLVARNGIDTVADLRGKKIAYDVHGSTVERETLVVLQTAHLDASDVEMLPVGESPNRAAAVLAGEVDAAILSVPDNLRTEDVAHTVLRVGDVFSAPLAGLSASDAHLNANPQEAQAMVNGVLQGTAFIKANKAATVQELATFANLTPDQASSVYDDVVGTWSDSGIVSDQDVLSTLTDPQLATSADPSKLVDWTYANHARS